MTYEKIKQIKISKEQIKKDLEYLSKYFPNFFENFNKTIFKRGYPLLNAINNSMQCIACKTRLVALANSICDHCLGEAEFHYGKTNSNTQIGTCHNNAIYCTQCSNEGDKPFLARHARIHSVICNCCNKVILHGPTRMVE